MSNTKEKKKNNQPKITTSNSNAEYVYIIENQEVWFIDYIVGIAFKQIWYRPTRIRKVIY
jgi:hypothetical protein